MSSKSLIGEKTHLDLNNYFAEHQSFNSIVYFHKKFLAKHSGTCAKQDDNKLQSNSTNMPTTAPTVKVPAHLADSKIKNKHDKLHQNRDPNYVKEKRKRREINESLIHQTKKIAKNTVPLILPPSLDSSHEVYYTIKYVKPKKAQKKEKTNIVKAEKAEYIDAKNCVETYRKDTCFRESSTAMESTSRMTSLQELKISGSLNYSLSEISNRPNKNKYNAHRENTTCKINQQPTKLVASESLQALADGINQSSVRGNEIKLHVMTDQDKTVLTEGVHNAVIRAVRDCIEEISKCKGSCQDLVTVQKTVKYNSDKLDNILDRLSNVEISIANAVREKTYIKPIDTETKVLLKHTPRGANASTLEQLDEDLLEHDISEADDNVQTFNSYDIRNDVRNLESVKIKTIKAKSEIGNQGCREEIQEILRAGASSTDKLDFKGERTNRIPTRYCWTDVNSRPNRR